MPRRPVFAEPTGASPEPPSQQAAAITAVGGAAVTDADSYHRIVASAEEHFARGDAKTGASLLRGVFTHASHRAEVDLVPHVLRLLEIDDDPLWRGKYIDYLVRREAGGLAFARQLDRASALGASEAPADLQKAWVELSRAHDLAQDAAQRQKVFEILGPILARHVLSGRFSPLVETYTVKPGDNLTRIARRYQTTPEAIQRLSGLESEVIQPRSRVRLVPGQVKLFVDKSEFLLWLTVDDKVLLQKPVGLGKNNATPTGAFVIDVRQKDPTWYRPGEPPIPAGDPRNVLGTRWLGFKDTDEVSGIGIHGTGDPQSIGRESSQGCIRLLNEDIELVYDFVPLGTSVVVRD
jgi:lipoprotein-anchoring transpeptidase ErfK/SrfK